MKLVVSESASECDDCGYFEYGDIILIDDEGNQFGFDFDNHLGGGNCPDPRNDPYGFVAKVLTVYTGKEVIVEHV